MTSIERIEQLKAREILVLNDAFHILNEYDKHLSHRGQPGFGDAFYQWALRNRHNSLHCEQVSLEISENGSFSAFPSVSELTKFDSSDRKFMATTLTHPTNPSVVNAADKDWHEHHPALSRHGVRVEFICPAEITRPRRA